MWSCRWWRRGSGTPGGQTSLKLGNFKPEVMYICTLLLSLREICYLTLEKFKNIRSVPSVSYYEMFRTVFRDVQNLSLRILWNLSRMQLSNSKGVKLLRSPTLFYNHFRLVVFMFFMLYCVFFRAGNSLIRSFAHRLFSHRSFAHLLISLKSNERM